MSRAILRARFALLVLLAACGPAPGSPDGPRPITPFALEPPPIYALLGFRDELALESAQVSALDSIALGVRDRNRPLIDSLEASADRNRAGFLQVDAQTAPLLEQIRENHRSAVEGVREVLDEAQESTACRLFDEARDRRDGEDRDRRVRTPADSVMFGLGGRVWSWCGAPPPAGG